jgi:pimeloyl-ACP methyl ester carboxylesterase
MKRIRRVAALIAAVAVATGLSAAALTPGASAHTASPATKATGPKPTIVLVHGAWADASGWTPVIERLEEAGYPVDAPPNPLRGLTYDSEYIASVLKQIEGPIVLVGHSYGGAVITNAAEGDPNVKALVYIAAWALGKGQSLASLSAMPVAACTPSVPTIATTYPEPGGGTGTELTINPAKYSYTFLDNELPAYEAQAMAAEQRPLSLDAITETSGTPAWRTIPSWYMVATRDHAICPNLERFMAAQAHAHTVQVSGPHLIMVTNPGPVTSLIEQAADATTGR